jgi:hypothetical protein
VLEGARRKGTTDVTHHLHGLTGEPFDEKAHDVDWFQYHNKSSDGPVLQCVEYLVEELLMTMSVRGYNYVTKVHFGTDPSNGSTVLACMLGINRSATP